MDAYTFASYVGASLRTYRGDQETSFMRKQKKLIMVLAIVCCILAGVYFAVVMPIINREEPPETTEPIETTDGEVIGASDRILMFEQITREYIKSIKSLRCR